MTYRLRAYRNYRDDLYDCIVAEREPDYDREFERPVDAVKYMSDPPYIDDGYLTFSLEDE